MKGEIWTAVFWRATAERSVSTAAQAVILVLGADVINGGINAAELNWGGMAGFAAGGAFLTVLKSLAAAKITGGGPSFTNAEQLDPSDPPP